MVVESSQAECNFMHAIQTGIWGGKGQGKSFQTELIFQAMGIEPVIMSAGELESERAGKILTGKCSDCELTSFSFLCDTYIWKFKLC